MKSNTKKSDIESITQRTDNANATRFITEYGSKLRYVVSWRKWLGWTGKKWCLSSGDDRVMRYARDFAKQLWKESAEVFQNPLVSSEDKQAILTFVRQCNDARRIENMVKLARHDDRVSVQHDQLDGDPYLLNFRNGTLELKSMSFRDHQPEDLLTHISNVNYDPDATCPKWLETVELIFDGDTELIEYVQTILGYCLSGDVGQHILPIGYGSGCNGKSTLWNVLVALMGDYAMLANDSLLLGDKDSHPTEKAALYGKRFVPVSEPERNSRLKESRVKELTGDSTITARRMKEDFWSFERTHKFFLATNHLPKVDGADEGIWRRIKLIPFSVDLRTKVTPDPNIVQKMIATESSGIMNWLVAGWRRYLASYSIPEPTAVRQATSNYRSDSDALGEFLSEYCIAEPTAVAAAKELFTAYRDGWGGKWSSTTFGKAMSERFDKEKPTSGDYRLKVIYRGIRLRNETDDTQEKQGVLPVVTSSAVNFPCGRIDGLIPQLGTTGNKSQLGGEYDLTF